MIRSLSALGAIGIALAFGSPWTHVAATPLASSQWVHPGADGKLIYKTTPAGDRIMDFSTAGYMGGGVALPTVPVRVTVKPSGEQDDTAAIQTAIDKVAAMKLADRFRGAVLLAPGIFTCSGTLVIPASGVVVRGSGSGRDGTTTTTIKMIGGRHSAFAIGGRSRRGGGDRAESGGLEQSAQEFKLAQTTIADGYVPSGTTVLTVADTTGFAVGDTVAIRRPITPAWIHFMQMDTLTRDGRHQTWLGSGRNDSFERTITAISGSKLTLDIPLPDSLDAAYLDPPGTTVIRVRPSTPLTQAGIECLKIQCPPMEIAYGQAPYSAIRIDGEDCWVKDALLDQTINSTVMRGKRITMQQVSVLHKFPNLGASKPTDFSIEGTQILLDRCSITGDNMYFVWTASLDPGPNVLLNCTFHGHGRIQPHMRWSTGLLVDNCRVPEGGIDLMDRGVMGSGHGWTMGWGVAWNCFARTYVVQNPPGAVNWAIGCIGQSTPTPQPFDKSPNMPLGLFDAHGTRVAPQSLYLAQLAERLGPQAVRNTGYSLERNNLFADSSDSPDNSALDLGGSLGADLALHRPVNASNVRDRSRTFGGEKAVDGDKDTYWTTSDGVTNAWIEVDLEGAQELNAAEIQEAAGLGNRVTAYKIEGQVDSEWKLLAQGTTIGERKLDRFPLVKAWKVRLMVRTTQGSPAIRKFGLYLDNAASPTTFEPPNGAPGSAN